MPKGIRTAIVTVFFVALGLSMPTPGLAQDAPRNDSGAEAAKDSNESRPGREAARAASTLSEIAQTFREIAVLALGDRPEGVRVGVISTRAAVWRLRPLLDSETYAQLESQLAGIEELSANGDKTGTALAANDAFKIAVTAISPAARRMPLEVAMQNYSGLKLTILASAAEVNWEAIKLTAKESEKSWIKLRRAIRDTNMRVLLSEIQSGLSDAAARQDAAGVRFAARMQLASVAVLRDFFERFARAMAKGR